MEYPDQGLQNVGTSDRKVCSAFLPVQRAAGSVHRIGTSCGTGVMPSVVYLLNIIKTRIVRNKKVGTYQPGSKH